MDMQKKYDDLDNIISTIRILVDEIDDEDYKEQLQYIQFKAEDEIKEVDAELQKEYDREEAEMNKQFIFERI